MKQPPHGDIRCDESVARFHPISRTNHECNGVVFLYVIIDRFWCYDYSMETLEIIRGDSFLLNLEFDDDITGSTVFFTAKKSSNVPDADAVLSTEVTSHTDPTNGKTVIEFNATDTSNIEPGAYVYDVQLKHSDGEIESWDSQKLYIKADITQRTT